MPGTLDSLFPQPGAVLLDGGTGRELRAQGWSGPCTLANLHAPGLVATLARQFQRSGAGLLLTNTFDALAAHAHERLAAVVAGVRIARKAADGVPVGLSLAAWDLKGQWTPLSEVLTAACDEGVEFLAFETCNQLTDALAALEAAQRIAPRLPIVLSASTTDGSREDRKRVTEVVEHALELSGQGVTAGMNCGTGPHEMLRLAVSMSSTPRWLKPNTGRHEHGHEDTMAAFARAAQQSGARFIGGCCGTGPETLGDMGAALETPT